jgi:ArsR family transcriptional regulator
MPVAKAKNLEQVARWFHAVSDETRLRIIECLEEGEQCVCDLMVTLDTAQSRLSFHLKTLKDAGLVNDRRAGRWMYYSLNADTLEDMRDAMAGLTSIGSTRKTTRPCE